VDKRILETVVSAIDELNETREEKIPTDDVLELGLYGNMGIFDSMHLVSFLALVEEKLEDDFGAQVVLASEKAVSRRVSPFSTVQRLVEFIEEELRLAGAPL
jgi:acyl carrier protein